MVDQILEGRLKSVSEADMVELYINMLLTYSERFAQFVTVAADVDYLPMLFHCTAGKDRSGLASALLLEVLGVERDTVLDDYCLTNELRSRQRIEELRPQFADVGIDISDVRADSVRAARGVGRGTWRTRCPLRIEHAFERHRWRCRRCDIGCRGLPADRRSQPGCGPRCCAPICDLNGTTRLLHV